MTPNYMQILEDFASDIFDNVSSYYGSNIPQLEEAYESATNNELSDFISKLNKEIVYYKSKGKKITDYEKNKLKLAMKDLEEVETKLASRKKGK